MLVVDVFRLATRMFRTNRSRTLLTILGIGVGIGAILFLVSLGYGLQQLILNQITTSDALLSLDVTIGDLEELRLNSESVEDIKQVPGVDKVSPIISAQTQMIVDDISSELLVNFAESDFFKLDGTMLMKGDFYNDSPEDEYKIIITTTALMLFNISEEDAMDKQIKFTLIKNKEDERTGDVSSEYIKIDKDFEIVGIIDDENSAYIYMPFAQSKQLESDDYSKIKVRVNSDENLDAARNAIMDKGFMVSALSDIIEQANQVFRVLQIVLASFGIVALVVSAIGMFNTMTIALLERTQEIGIMKALGATGVDIWKMFLAESVIIGFLGGAGGILIGLAGGEGFNYGINLLAGAMGGDRIDMFYTPLWFTTLIIVFSTVVGLITGFYPAKRAANINSLEALRYK